MSRARRAILAVFGGNGVGDDVLALAEDLGHAISDRHVVLTGGSTPQASGNVKDRALWGARAGPWIGVSKSKDGRIDGGPEESGFVIRSGLDDRRNYLNAFLCDGAIALEGGSGTISEAVFTMALGKPIVLVGERDWRAKLDFDEKDRHTKWADAVEWVTQKAFSWGELDRQMAPSAILECLRKTSPSPVLRSSESGADEILRSLTALLPPNALERAPCFPHPRYDEVAKRLSHWVSRLETSPQD